MTTIRVEKMVRDRLASLAEAHGRSLGAELNAMLDELVWQGIEHGYDRLRSDETALGEYSTEAEMWSGADLDGLSDRVAGEYPEHQGVG